MEGRRNKQVWLGVTAVLALAITTCGLFLRLHTSAIRQTAATTNPSQSSSQQMGTASAQSQPAASNWNTFHDTGFAGASGISIEYPSDWKVEVGNSKAYAWSLSQTANVRNSINVRYIFLATSETAQQEWNTCGVNVSADACGGAPGDKIVSGNTTTINGLDAYAATIQNDSGTYHVTVIRGNKATSNGTPYVEFTTTSNDPAALNSFAAIAKSATFPN